jgi:HD superfamily phosphohydrolase
MIVHDPIYGQFFLPKYLVPLAQAPEVRRLSQIRLLNTLTPSLATLGELRRYSHTLGVIYLADVNLYLRGCANEKKAFLAGVLLHDIGTPPFGHLFEYHLSDLYGWSHEKVIKAILWGQHVPEGRGHQIYGRQTVRVRKLLGNSEVDLTTLEAIINGEHPLANLLFGTVDFDNLDNVARMNWALGIRGGGDLLDLAKHLGLAQGRLTLPSSLRPAVQAWLDLRKRAYEIIVFDAPTVAAQAVLSSALRTALEAGVITEDDWPMWDEQLLEKLLDHRATKNEIATEYLGQLPRLVYQVQIAGTLESLSLPHRTAAVARIIESLQPFMPKNAALGYVFADKGSFSKRVSFLDPQTECCWELGKNSESVVLYAFIRHTARISHSDCMAAIEGLLSSLGVSGERVLRCDVGSVRNIANAQRTLDIAASQD